MPEWGGWAAYAGADLGIRLAIGFILAAIVAGGGWATRALTVGGAVAALLVGGAVFGLGGPEWGLLVVLFFVTSSAASRWREEEKARPARTFAKSSRRDVGQVLANGIVPAGLAVLGTLFPDSPGIFAAFVGAVAAVTADTWATEIGLLSDAQPTLITTGEPVPRGTSGGVTLIGTVAAAAGAATIGLAAAGLFTLRDVIAFGSLDTRLLNPSALRLLPVAAAAGLASAAFDSYLGATRQAIYVSTRLKLETERPEEEDGTKNDLVRGWRWLNNDRVNLLASIVGAVVAWTLYGAP